MREPTPPTARNPRLHITHYPGLTPYVDAWDEQRRLHALRVADEIPDTVLLLEHEPVYTAGKRTNSFERPVDSGGAPVVDVDRGGRITWHGPGQVVGYPIVKLRDPVDVVAYVRRVEQLMIDVCASFGVAADRVDGRSGAWIVADGPESHDKGPDRKIGAVGLRVAKGVTMHGFALYCNHDLSWFDRIVPCGISDAATTSMSREIGRDISVADALPVVQRYVDNLADLGAVTADSPSLVA